MRTASCGQENYFYSSEDLSNDETRGWEVWPSPKCHSWHVESEESGTCSPTDHKLCSLHLTRGWRLQQGNIGSGYKLNNGIISQRGHTSQTQPPAPATMPPSPSQCCWHNVWGNQTYPALYFWFETWYDMATTLRLQCNSSIESPVSTWHVSCDPRCFTCQTHLDKHPFNLKSIIPTDRYWK